ncbi:MAG: LysR family transcriptional regulator [Pseudodonghicola sp.]
MEKEFDLKKIDLNLLHIFEAIYTARSVTRAASQLNMTQPTMSNALGRLRDQLHDPLFQRSQKGVEPTLFADSLIGPVRQALSILRDGLSLDQDFQVADAVRTFHLVFNEFAVTTLLPNVLAEVTARSPGVKLRVLGARETSPLDALHSGEAEIAIDTFAREEPGIDLTPIHMPRIVVVARCGHPSIKGSLTRDQYCEARHIVLSESAPMRAYVESALLSQGIRRTIACEISNGSQIPALVAETDLIGILPDIFAYRLAQYYNLQVMSPPFDFPSQRIQIAVLSERASDAGIVWLRQQLQRSAMRVASAESWLPRLE